MRYQEISNSWKLVSSDAVFPGGVHYRFIHRGLCRHQEANVEANIFQQAKCRNYVLRRTFSAQSVAWSPDGRMLASAGGSYRTVRLWDPATGEQLAVLEGHTDYVSSVAWSPDGRTLASGSRDDTVRLWGLPHN